jgi:hypothetical protein
MQNLHISLFPIIFGCFLIDSLLAQSPCDEKNELAREQTVVADSWFTANRIFNIYSGDGQGSTSPLSGKGAFEFPTGSGKTVVFQDGFVWGGFHKGRISPKVNGSSYRSGLLPGTILTPGGPTEDDPPTPADPNDSTFRVYRVRPDITPSTPFESVRAILEAESTLISRTNLVTSRQLFDQYVRDWNTWPGGNGRTAPYRDLNGNSIYEPTVDIPGEPGATQTLYFVCNDANASASTKFAFSPPIGLEMHRTIWGYDRDGGIGQTIFMRTVLINKSGAPVDSMFIGQWSDPDVGGPADDGAGCDVARALGFVYNGKPNDEEYGNAAPAVGYALLEGPAVATGNPGDSAIVGMRYRRRMRNLGMTSFWLGECGSSVYTDPPLGVVGSDVGWYRILTGYSESTGWPFINPLTGLATKYIRDGDPVTGSGWIEGSDGSFCGDRRILVASGPFTLANGDTQEVVFAAIVGQGPDRLSSVNVLKHYAGIVEAQFANLMQIPPSPPAPLVTAGAVDGRIMITWGEQDSASKVESWSDAGYSFEGYNVYQVDPATRNRVRLATYDIVNGVSWIFDDIYDPSTGLYLFTPAQFGTDAGIRRYFETGRDTIGRRALRTGEKYAFGVSAYGFNRGSAKRPTQLESPLSVVTVTPSWQDGIRLTASAGDTLAQMVHTGPSSGKVIAIVRNPVALPTGGAVYRVAFREMNSRVVWDIIRTAGARTDTVLQGMPDPSSAGLIPPIVDGIAFDVQSTPSTFTGFYTVSNANGPIVPWQEGCFAFNASGFPLTPDNFDRPFGSLQQPGSLSGSQGWGIHTGMTTAGMSSTFSNFVNRVTNNGSRWRYIIPYDFEWRFTARGGKALLPDALTGNGNHLIDVPFELWNIGIGTPDDPSDDYRMFPNILDVDGNNAFNLLTDAGVAANDFGGGGATHSISAGGNDPFTDWIYWVLPRDTSHGESGYNAVVNQVQSDIAGGIDPYLSDPTTQQTDVLRRIVLVGWNFGQTSTGTYAMQMPQPGTTFRIVTSKPNTARDCFMLTLPAARQPRELAQADADRVNVYPNPFITSRFALPSALAGVTFTHLPARTTIRIFTLAGTLVRTLIKEDTSQILRWDMTNQQGGLITSGMYIAHVDMPDIGKVKIIKFAAIAAE